MQAYISGRNVNLTFRPPNRGPVRALQNFDIDIGEGEFLSIVGPSGCGKSTFLNVLLGLVKPDSGDIRMDGKPITGPGTDRAMVFQEFGLLPWRTVQHNVELGLELKGMAADARRKISEAADRDDRALRLREPLPARAFRRHEAARGASPARSPPIPTCC
jgi:NitT/TauT family transport system ATP-binding protein